MRRKCPGLKHDTEAVDARKRVVEEHFLRDEAVPKGAVDFRKEKMPE